MRNWLLLIVLTTVPTLAFSAENKARPPVRVVILAGQSNTEGKAKVTLLDYQAKQPATAAIYKHLRQGDNWVVRDDVHIKFLDRHGKLTVGFGSPNCIGPELGLGMVLGDHYDGPVLLIKTAWGGRSLFRDFRSPSAGLPAETELNKMLVNLQKRTPNASIDDVKRSFGVTYGDMLKEVRETLVNIKDYVPGYDGEGHELIGFVWFQGWNDMISPEYTAEYTSNLRHFIQDVRKDFDAPQLPFVIGQMGVDGVDAGENIQKFKQAQAAVMEAAGFQDHIALVKTDIFWDAEAAAVYKKGWRENIDEWNTVGSDYPFHYLGSGKTMLHIGDAFGQALLKIQPKN